MAKVSKELWIARVKEAATHFGIPVMTLTKTKFERFTYREAADRAADAFNSWEELLRIASLSDEEQIELITKESKKIIGKIKEPEIYKSPFDFDFTKYKEITHPTDFTPAKIYDAIVNPGDIIFAIPDTHFPFHHNETIKLVIKQAAELYEECQLAKVTLHIIQLGDLLDLYGFSKYEKLHSLDPKKEIEIAMEMAKKFWDALPKGIGVKRYQLAGNHDIRAQKYVMTKAPELKGFIPSTKELLSFDEVFTCSNDKDGIMFKSSHDKALATHGFLSDSEAHVRKFKCSVIHGHTHQAALNFITLDTGLCFALNCGFLGDEKTYALAYSSTAHSKNWVLNASIIRISKQGRFLPALNTYLDKE